MKKLLVLAISALLLVQGAFAQVAPTVTVDITEPSDGSSTCEATTCVRGVASAIGGGGDLDVVFIMDISGSMSWNDPDGLRVVGAKALVDMLPEGTQVAIAVTEFSSWPTLVQNFTSNHTLAKDALDATNISTSGTDIGAAVDMANQLLNSSGRPGAAWVEILFTDGVGSYSPAYTADAISLGITIHTMGLSSEVDEVLLAAIANDTGGTYTFVENASSVPDVFPSLTLTNIANVTVNGNLATVFPNGAFEYCGLGLGMGSNPITALATATTGETGTDSISVTRETCQDAPFFPAAGVPLGIMAATLAGAYRLARKD